MADSHHNTHHDNGHAHGGEGHAHGNGRPEYFEVRVLRQDGPGQPSYWERHRVKYEPEMNVISVLQRIAASATTADGRHVPPVAWDCNCLEEVCGACTMLINGRVRQSCSALVDKLLAEKPDEIELQPMTKFPVVRDLCVDRGRHFRTLAKIKGWVDVDGYYFTGPGPRQSQKQQEFMYPFSECMSCGCCMEACPQYLKVEVERYEGETEDHYRARQDAEYDRHFIGPATIGQAVLFNMNPIGAQTKDERLEAVVGEGGIQVCGNAQNCVAVCPKNIPLTHAIGVLGRQATLYSIKKWFDKK